MWPVLDEQLWFPNPRTAPQAGPLNGLVAIGGDLSAARLLLAYRSGIFPWTVDPITWWSPEPRAVLELDQFHLPRSLAKLLRKEPFKVTRDAAFPSVIAACAAPGPGRLSTWISREFIAAYTQLHSQGHAHSVECWQAGQLVGGIYGVSVGGFFSGESMFHRVSNASKVALHELVRHLQERGFGLLDIQMTTQHTQGLGATTVPRDTYLERLAQAVDLPCRF